MLKLLIAVDGSPASLRAIDTAARLGRDTPVEAVLLHVRDAPSYHGDIPPYDYERIAAAQRRHQDGVLESALAHATAAGLGAVQTQAELGTAAADIKARYGDDVREQPNKYEDEILELVLSEGATKFVFEIQDGSVRAWRAGVLPTIDYVEHCS